MLKDSQIRKAASTCRRRKTVKQKERALAELGRTHRRRHDVRICGTTPTAHWRTETMRGRLVDVITVGSNFDACMQDPCNPTKAHAALVSVLTHEACHGLYTNAEAKPAAAEMRRFGMPFRLLNIFEDIRIEHLYRVNRPAGERFRFNWDKLLTHVTTHDTGVGYLMALSSREASAFKTMSSAARTLSWTGNRLVTCKSLPRYHNKQTRLVIWDFYNRACAARTALDLVPIIKEWVQIFGADRPEPETVDGWRESDEIAGETCPIEGDGDGDGGGDGAGAGGGAGAGDGAGCDNGREYAPSKTDGPSELTGEIKSELEGWFSVRPQDIDRELQHRMVQNIRQVRECAARVNGELSIMGGGLYMPNVMVGAANSFLSQSTETGHREITVVVDMSGSMRHAWEDLGGCEFIIALAELHQLGELTVNCWLTESSRSRIKLPMDKIKSVDIRRIETGGSEGLARTLKAPEVREDITRSSLTVFWTDGEICDGGCRAQVDELNRAGADIIGLAPVPSEREAGSSSMRNIAHYIGRGWVDYPVALTRKLAEYVINPAH